MDVILIILFDRTGINHVRDVEPTGQRHKITGTYSCGGQEHFYLEPTNALVVPTGEKDEMDVYFGGGSPATTQGEISYVLGIPAHKIAVK